jgi:ATP phosphoribosyltransferase regulatory subunit
MIPEGMRDVLPAEAAELHALEELLRARFAAFGYREVRTPVIEFVETLEQADDDVIAGGYRAFDEQGRVLMLRTDMTVPVARLAATRFDDKPLPLRFSYVGSSFRTMTASRSQNGEFLQAGCELIGAAGPQADAEVVALVCDVLAATGLKEYRVTIGTVAFHKAMMESLRLPPDQAEAALEALADRDYALLESIVGNADVDEEAQRALQQALQLGGDEDALRQARKLASSAGMEHAVDHLVRVRDLVEDYGFREVVQLDFGLYPALSFYTGLILEAYAPGVGLPVATGGRYDRLLGAFEFDAPGIGFALALDRLNVALEEAHIVLPTQAAALSFVGGLDDPALAAELRRAGWNVVALPADAEQASAPKLYRDAGQWVLDRGGGQVLRGSLRDARRALGLS